MNSLGMSPKLWESDYVQFPYLLSMISTIGLSDYQRDRIAKHMDISLNDLHYLFLRAHKKWSSIVETHEKRGNRGRRRKVARQADRPLRAARRKR